MSKKLAEVLFVFIVPIVFISSFNENRTRSISSMIKGLHVYKKDIKMDGWKKDIKMDGWKNERFDGWKNGKCVQTNNSIFITLKQPHAITHIKFSADDNLRTLQQTDLFVLTKEQLYQPLKFQQPEFCGFGSGDMVICDEVVVGDVVLALRNHIFKADICNVTLLTCKEGYFGVDCGKQCHCAGGGGGGRSGRGGEVCEVATGECPSKRCAAGYHGDDCQQVCRKNTFGENCLWKCQCSGGGGCDRKSGSCGDVACRSGFYGFSCQTKLPNLKKAPIFESNTATTITISWELYNNNNNNNNNYNNNNNNYDDSMNIDSDVSVIYSVLHKKRGNDDDDDGGDDVDGRYGEGGDGDGKRRDGRREGGDLNELELGHGEWMVDGDVYHQKGVTKQTATITNLDTNSKYQFIVQPRLQVNTTTNIHSSPSPPSPFYNTRFQFKTSFYPVTFQPSFQVTASTEASTKWRAAGLGIGMVAVMMVVLVVVVFARRRIIENKYSELKKSDQNIETDNSDLLSDVFFRRTPSNQSASLNRSSYPATSQSPSREEMLKISRPIMIENLETMLHKSTEIQYQDLIEEFHSIPVGLKGVGMQTAQLTHNLSKNRFKDVLPYDEERVMLKGDSEDYINASYIRDSKRRNVYIATQGPKEQTTNDFWRLVWQEKCSCVVMLTNLVERGVSKCHQYWPEHLHQATSYDHLNVTLTNVITTAYYVIRSFIIQPSLSSSSTSPPSSSRKLTQFQYTAWPDQGVPANIGQLMLFRKKVRSCDLLNDVIIVHCSAGIGRTGTFIACDWLMESIEGGVVGDSLKSSRSKETEKEKLNRSKEGGGLEGGGVFVDLVAMTVSLRLQRYNMIQRPEQYILVYKALLQEFQTPGCCVNKKEMLKYYNIIKCNNNNNNNKKLNKKKEFISDKEECELMKQFKKLKDLSGKETFKKEVVMALELENKDKNRYSSVHPDDKDRPYLTSVVDGTNDYINATFLDGYSARNAYISTQMPLPHTAIDLWRLVFEHDVRTIIMLNSLDDDVVKEAQYWPEEGEECECGPFKLQCGGGVERKGGVVCRPLVMSFLSNVLMNSCSKSHYDNNTRSIQLIHSSSLHHLLPSIYHHHHKHTNTYENYDTNYQNILRNNNQQNINNDLNNNNIKKDIPTSPTAATLSTTTNLFSENDVVVKKVVEDCMQLLQLAQHKPLLVQCMDGRSHSGLMVGVGVMMEAMKTEGEVDVCRIAAQLQTRLPSLFNDPKQLQFLYECACHISSLGSVQVL